MNVGFQREPSVARDPSANQAWPDRAALSTAMAFGHWSITALHYGDDLKEGLGAGTEKRSPRFHGS